MKNLQKLKVVLALGTLMATGLASRAFAEEPVQCGTSYGGYSFDYPNVCDQGSCTAYSVGCSDGSSESGETCDPCYTED